MITAEAAKLMSIEFNKDLYENIKKHIENEIIKATKSGKMYSSAIYRTDIEKMFGNYSCISDYINSISRELCDLGYKVTNSNSNISISWY